MSSETLPPAGLQPTRTAARRLPHHHQLCCRRRPPPSSHPRLCARRHAAAGRQCEAPMPAPAAAPAAPCTCAYPSRHPLIQGCHAPRRLHRRCRSRRRQARLPRRRPQRVAPALPPTAAAATPPSGLARCCRRCRRRLEMPATVRPGWRRRHLRHG
eukprot:356333-Chlamydomonas_euryale.AAC.2